MSEEKTCWNCKFREFDYGLKPCSECENFNNWEKRDD